MSIILNGLLNIKLIVLFAVLDVLLFTCRDNSGLFWQLLFSSWIGTNGRKYYYIYRPFQFILLAAGLYITYITAGIIPAIAYLLAFAVYVTDLLYYLFNLELNELFAFERTEIDTYWLEHFYQIGHYTWKHFSLKQFMLYSIAGTIILIITNII